VHAWIVQRVRDIRHVGQLEVVFASRGWCTSSRNVREIRSLHRPSSAGPGLLHDLAADRAGIRSDPVHYEAHIVLTSGAQRAAKPACIS
jgi:hypothetical protein